MNILVIDAQGGGIGRQLVSQIKQQLPEAHNEAVPHHIKNTVFT